MGTEGAGDAESGHNEDEWLQDLIDIFAAEPYHWSKKQTLEEVYPEEVPLLLERMAKRRKNQALEKVSEYRTLLQIAVAPHTERGKGVEALNQQFDEMEKDIKDPVRVKSRVNTRSKLEELLLQQIKEG